MTSKGSGLEKKLTENKTNIYIYGKDTEQISFY